MKPPTPTPIPNPSLKPPVGPNWKLIRNLFIIAGLLFAISIAWDLRQEARARREAENQRRIKIQAKAREDALAEAREKAQAEIRKREAELAASTRRVTPVIPPERNPPVERSASQMVDSTSQRPIHKNASIEQPPEPEIPSEIANLNSKARDLIMGAGRKRDEQLSSNASKLSWDLDLHVRTLPKSEQNYWSPHVNRLKNSVKNHRVPASIMRARDFDLSKKMEELIDYALRKQKEIDREFLAESAKIQSAYLRKIGEAAAQADTAGQKPLADLLNRKIANATNLDSWLLSLGVDESAQVPTP